MESNIKLIDSLMAELQALLPMKPEFQREYDKKIRLEFNYNSNHIEGNTLTYGETELLLIFDKTTGNHELREYEEMKSHDVAFEMIKEWAVDIERPLTEAAIKNLHELLLVRPFWKEAITDDGQPTRRQIKIGAYKEFSNTVRLQNGELFYYATPADTPALMGELIAWYRDEEEKAQLHPVEFAALLHYKFVQIHPFDDGNGRLSRLLMNYVLIRNNYPPVIIKSENKKDYLFALSQADSGDIIAFVNFIAKQQLHSLALKIKAAKGISLEEESDLDKKISILKKELHQIDPANEIHEHFSYAVLVRSINTWIGELIEKSVVVIQNFGELFTESRHYVSIRSLAYVSFSVEPPEAITQKIVDEVAANEAKFNVHDAYVQIQAFYGTLKKGGLNTFGCNYSIEVKFSLIKYEVFVDEFNDEMTGRKTIKLFEHLLHRPLGSTEIEQVCKNLKHAIYSHIEVKSREVGLR
jgi:Fic family protein